MAGAFFFGFSATIASVVMRPATDAASCRAHDLGRVDHALLDQVAIFASRGIEAEGIDVLVDDLAHDHCAVLAGIFGDLTRGSLNGAAYDIDADLLVLVRSFDLIEHLLATDQSYAAAGQDALLDSRASRVQRIVDAILLLLHLDLGGTADLDHGNAA